MDDWDPESSVTIADRVGIAIVDLKVPQSQHVSAKDRLDIRVRCWAGEGPPAIPLHCGSLSTRTWDDVAIALRTDFRPFAVAHRASDWAKTIVEAATTTSSFPSRGCRWAEVGGCEFAPRYLGRVESRVKIDVTSWPVFGATERMRTAMSKFRGAPTVIEVVLTALAVQLQRPSRAPSLSHSHHPTVCAPSLLAKGDGSLPMAYGSTRFARRSSRPR